MLLRFAGLLCLRMALGRLTPRLDLTSSNRESSQKGYRPRKEGPSGGQPNSAQGSVTLATRRKKRGTADPGDDLAWANTWRPVGVFPIDCWLMRNFLVNAAGSQGHSRHPDEQGEKVLQGHQFVRLFRAENTLP